MASARAAWGIDIGNRALKAIKLVNGPEGLRVDDFDVIEHESILSNAGDNKESMIQSALANFVQRHDVKKIPFAMSVSGQSSFARFIKLPPVEPRKIPEIVRFEAIQQIPFPLDDVEWAYQLFESEDSPEVEVGIFAMRKELVDRQISYLTNLALNVQVVQMSPLAVYNAMQHDGRIKGTTMFMDAGAENTDLVIADAETVWLRTLPIGGNNFTETLAKAFKLNFTKAEELKRNAATSKYAKQIFQAMRPVFADLVAEIQRSIGFYTAGHRDARIKKIIALGSTFRLPGLQKYLQQNLQIEVERIDAFRAAPPADGKLAAQFSENLVSLAGPYGLALQAMGESKIASSLLPARIRKEKMWREKTKWFAAAAALFLFGTGLGYARYFMDDGAFNKNESQRDRQTQTVKAAQALDAQYANDVQSKGAEDRTQILQVQSLQNGRHVWAHLFKDIHEALPQDPALAGKTPDQYKLVKPRGERNVIYIDSIRALNSYSVDLAKVIDPQQTPDDDFGRLANTGGAAGSAATPAPPANPTEAAPPSTVRGFLVTVRGFTPRTVQNSAGRLLIKQTLEAKLATLTAKAAWDMTPRKPYYVARIWLAQAGRRRSTINRELDQTFTPVAALTTAMTVTGGGGAVRPVVPTTPQIPADQIDPMTGEPIQQGQDADTEFTLLIAVVLDPPRPAPPADAEEQRADAR